MVGHEEVESYFNLRESVANCGHIEDLGSRTEILPSTAGALELKLFYQEIFPKTKTTTGATMLAHSLISPPRDLQVIKARQEAVRELKENDNLRQNIAGALERIHFSEKGTLNLLGGTSYNLDSSIFAARELLGTSINELGSLDKVESPYLKERVERLRSLKGKDIHRLSEGMIYRQGFRTPLHADQLNLMCLPWTVPNTLARFRPLTGIATAGLTGLTLYGLLGPGMEGASEVSKAMTVMSSALITGGVGLASASLAGFFERSISLPPLKRKLMGDVGAKTAYSSFGAFDEIFTLSKFAGDMEERGYSMAMPEIVGSEKQRVYCENLVNLIQARETKYTPNKILDLGSNGDGLNFITGPNSGGKTSSSKAVSLLQILGQMGSYVPAKKAVLSPADKIIYQVGVNDKQNDNEGGYGSQLKQTREILENAGPHSLVVVDDLMSGTEEAAMTKQIRNQFYGLHHTGANVLMITHRHDLAKEFKERTGKGNYLQIEFKGDRPTRQLIPGIAPTSRPDLVEGRVHMGEGDVEGLLKDRGFLKDGQGLYDVTNKG